MSKGIIDEIKVGHGSDTIASTVIPAEAYLILRLELRPSREIRVEDVEGAFDRFGKNSSLMVNKPFFFSSFFFSFILALIEESLIFVSVINLFSKFGLCNN